MNNTDYMDLLGKEIFGNTVQQYLIALGIVLGLLIVVKLMKVLVLKQIKKLTSKTKMQIDDRLYEVVDGVSWFFYVVLALYFGLQFLELSEKLVNFWYGFVVIVFVYQAIRVVEMIVEYALSIWSNKVDEDGEVKHTFAGLRLLIKIVLWAVGLLLILSNLGFDITTLVASLGIGGVAIALAIQNILGDIFSSFSIYFDKPFEVGDYIITGQHQGTVKSIGLKTTRLQSLQGEELVISNHELTTARVQNFKKMTKRRVSFELGVTYETDIKKLRKINEIVKDAIEGVEGTEFSRCHFWDFGDYSLNYEIVYFVLSREYMAYMDIQQEINLKILEEFKKEGIEMAFPTHAVQIHNQEVVKPKV